MWTDSPALHPPLVHGASQQSNALTIAIICIGVFAGTVAALGGWQYALAILVFAVLLRWPVEASLGTLALLLPFDSVASVGAEASGATLTRYVAALSATVLISLGLARNRFTKPPLAALWWSGFIFWGVVTLAWAYDPEPAWERLPTALSLLALYVVASSFAITKKELITVGAMAVLGGCAAAAMSSVQFFSGTSFHDSARSSLMIGGRETDPNQFAASLLLPLSLALGAVVRSRMRSVRLVGVAAVAVLGLALLLTMSRGGLLAALVVASVYLYRLRGDRRVLVGIACFGLMLLFMPHAFFERLSLADRGAGRMDIWAASLNLVPHYGFFGAGWNNFVAIYANVAGDAPHFHGFTEGSHNIYLGMLLEVGIVGLLCLLLAFRSQLRAIRNSSVLPFEAACWGMMAMGVTLDVVWRKSFWVCWILLAMAVRLYRTRDAETCS